jgi:hypothetical protein
VAIRIGMRTRDVDRMAHWSCAETVDRCSILSTIRTPAASLGRCTSSSGTKRRVPTRTLAISPRPRRRASAACDSPVAAHDAGLPGGDDGFGTADWVTTAAVFLVGAGWIVYWHHFRRAE